MKPGNCLANQPEANKEEFEFKLADFGDGFCKDTLNNLQSSQTFIVYFQLC